MKIGFQTIIWGPRIDNIEEALDIITEAGYQGVEFAQRPETLGDVERLQKLLRERKLTLIGLAGGTLQERMEFCGNFRPEYLYVENWDPDVAPLAVANGFTLALHPHMFKPTHRLASALNLLEEHPELKFIPDTAHLTIAGDDPAEAIRLTKDRLIAIHLKDWTPEFGRSCHRYGRGFVELGSGIVDLESVLKELQKINYGGWAVVEQDRTETDPQTSALACAEWLSKKGLLPMLPRIVRSSVSRRSRVFLNDDRTCPPEVESRFLRSIMYASTEGINTCYNSITEAFMKLVPCDLVTIWACTPAQNFMSLLAIKPNHPMSSYVLKCDKVLSGIAIDRHAITHFDLTDDLTNRYPGRQFGCPELLELLGVKRMVTIPVLNPDNSNHVLLVVNLFPKEEKLPVTDEELFLFGQDIAFIAVMALEGICSSVAAKVNHLAGRCRRSKDFLQILGDVIRSFLNCEGCSIFLVNDVGDKLELAATTGIEWTVPDNERFYRRNEGLTGKVWNKNEALFTIDGTKEPGRKGKSSELAQSRQDSCLLAPLVDFNGKVVGVVRCRNKRVAFISQAFSMFSDNDAAILDAIGQAAVPHLEVFLSEERRAKALGRLTHELKVPIVAIRGATEIMRRKEGVVKFFGYDFPGNIWSWSELMQRLLSNADFFRFKIEDIQMQAHPTLIMAEVIAPAVRQVGMLLRERSFSPDNIRYGRFEQVPRLWIDRNHFQQVMFNLLSNAIKYCYNDSNSFQVEIDGVDRGNEFALYFRDWGPGIDKGIEEAIFKEGIRGSNVIEKDIIGQGLGLWVVRQVVEAHGGRVKVTSRHLPTEFTIYLPKSLAWGPVRQTS